MINTFICVGRLTRDVELKKTQSGLSVSSFTVAVDRDLPSEKRQQSGVQTADFINCTAWRQTAEFISRYGLKGMLIAIKGRMTSRTYDRNDGSRATVTECLVENVNILERKKEAQQTQENQEPQWNNQDNGFDISNDDLPF